MTTSKRILLALIASTSLLTTTAQERSWVGAEISTVQSFKYGRMEFSMRAVNRSGVLANFFTYKNNSERTPSRNASASTVEAYEWEEIDLEIFGKNNARNYESNIIYEVDRNSRVDGNSEEHSNKSNYASGLTEFRIEWRPGSIRWFEKINGSFVRVREITTSNTSNNAEVTGIQEMDSPHTFRFNIWSSTNVGFAGTFNANDSSSQEAIIDYFRYYPLESTGRFSSTPTINDNFSGNSLNSSIWNIGDYTFEGNRARFVRSSVRVSGGRLRLKFGPGFTTRNGDDPANTSSKILKTIEKTAATSIYPNPLGNQKLLTVKVPSTTGGSIALYDTKGKKVFSKTFKTQKTQINFEALNLSKGLYILRLKTPQNITTSKLIL
jgi:hypothetical protein